MGRMYGQVGMGYSGPSREISLPPYLQAPLHDVVFNW